MKKLFIAVLLVIPILSVHARGIREDYRQAEEKAKVSYAIGLLMGSELISLDLDFDYTALAEGFKAAMGDANPQLSEREAFEIVDTALRNAMYIKNEENRLLEEEFLTKNGERPEIQITASGLQYEILVEAEGEKPEADSVVRVVYEGSFMDGSPFDSSGDDGAIIPLNMVIPGWTEGITLMSVGSKYRFYIPSELAYGKDGFQSIIPPYSTLIFTVELLEIVNIDEDESEEF